MQQYFDGYESDVQENNVDACIEHEEASPGESLGGEISKYFDLYDSDIDASEGSVHISPPRKSYSSAFKFHD
jgi:hypothetical protein